MSPKLAQLLEEMTHKNERKWRPLRPLSLSGGIYSSPNFSLTISLFRN